MLVSTFKGEKKQLSSSCSLIKLSLENIMNNIMTTFEFQAIEGKSEELLSFFKRIIPETRSFIGNQGAQISRLSMGKFMIIVYWEHEENLNAYLSWRDERGDFAMLLSFLNQAPTIITYEVLEDV